MKYSEFEKKVNKMGYEIEKGSYNNLNVVNNSGNVILRIYKDEICQIDNATTAFDKLAEKDKKDIFRLAIELASTPLEEREDEKCFYLQMRGLRENVSYVNYAKGTSEYSFDNNCETQSFKIVFNESDVEKMPETIRKAIECGAITKIEVK